MTTLKKKSTFVLGALTILAASLMTVTAAEGQNLKDVYNQAVKQYNAGQYEEALKGFEVVLKASPKYVYARNYAVKCRSAIDAGKKPVVNLEKQLAAIRIPSVDFNKTELGLVFEYITQKCEEISGGKIAANIIYQGTDADRKEKLVTLQLKDVPITQVIHYVGQLTRTKFKYEQYAIVATPVGSASATQVKPVQTATSKPRFDTTELPADPFKKK